MLEPASTDFLLLSFEGPDVYSQAGGLGVRVKELSRALAERGHETHLFFIGDPELAGQESLLDGRLVLHRWAQWVSRFHRLGVYEGEEGKRGEVERSLPEALVDRHIGPAVGRGRRVVVLGEEWQMARTMILVAQLLQARPEPLAHRIIARAGDGPDRDEADAGVLQPLDVIQ